MASDRQTVPVKNPSFIRPKHSGRHRREFRYIVKMCSRCLGTGESFAKMLVHQISNHISKLSISKFRHAWEKLSKVK
jgi:hypothetical protein